MIKNRDKIVNRDTPSRGGWLGPIFLLSFIFIYNFFTEFYNVYLGKCLIFNPVVDFYV